MKILALDVGLRRTGVAFLDDATGIPLPLETLTHGSEEELLKQVMMFIEKREIDRVVIGLPLLPSGMEGEQALHSRSIGTKLQETGMRVEYRDERHTTPRASEHKHALPTQNIDGDAAAACALLEGSTRS